MGSRVKITVEVIKKNASCQTVFPKMPLEVAHCPSQGEVHAPIFKACRVVIDEAGRIDGHNAVIAQTFLHHSFRDMNRADMPLLSSLHKIELVKPPMTECTSQQLPASLSGVSNQIADIPLGRVLPVDPFTALLPREI
jgi:hypothetical protein